MRSGLAALLSACVLAVSSAHAEGFWLPTGDQALRNDVTLLMDEGIIRIPVTTWPIPVADVRAAVDKVDADDLANEALRDTLLRVKARVALRDDAEAWQIREVSLSVGKQGALRGYDDLGRGDGELRSVGGTSNDRWGMTIAAAGVSSPIDGHHLVFDGSDLTIRWGNWLFSFNTLDRWYGPGEEQSLSLSNNARPMPQLSLDRMSSAAPDIPILEWIGPWRLTNTIGIGESHRPDLSGTRFLAQRFTFQPLPIVEIGLFRTAQFCGQYEVSSANGLAPGPRPKCGLSTLDKVLLGNSTTQINGITNATKPGKQYAGVDIRITSPIQALPVALYTQLNGADTTHTSTVLTPTRFLGLIGGEIWAYSGEGSTIRAHLEYSNTHCKFAESSTAAYDCAYRAFPYFAGYRYDALNIGATTDENAEFWIGDISLTRRTGESWGITLRHGSLDSKDQFGDLFNPITRGLGHYSGGEIYWNGSALAQSLKVQLGYARQSPGSPLFGDGLYGYVLWRTRF